MKKWLAVFRDLSLKSKLIIIYTPFIMLMILAIGLLTYRISIQKMEESKKNLVVQGMVQTNKLIDFNLETYLRKCEMIFSSTIIQEAIGRDYRLVEDKEIYNAYNLIYKNIEPMIQDLVYPNLTLKPSERATGTDMIQVQIYSNNPSFPKDGKLIRDYQEISGEDWVQEMLRNSTKPFFRSVFEEGGNRYISINRVLTDFKNLQAIGVLSIKIPIIRLEYLMKQDNANEQLNLYLLDGRGSVITAKTEPDSPIRQEEMQGMLASVLEKGGEHANAGYRETNDQTYLYAYTTSDLSGWNMLVVYPYRAILQDLSPIKSAVGILLAAGMAISVLLTFVISTMTTRRLAKIRRKMEIIKKDRYIRLGELQGNDEIGQLDRSFHEMIRTVNQLVEQEKELQAQKSSLQVELLQSQINPHLLYNTLAAIRWRSKKQGISDVSQVTDKLIRFFKYFLNKGAVMSSLANEVEMIRQYLDILRFTYDMDFQLFLRIDDSVYRCESLNLVLQPIVENAVIHGIRPLNDRQGLLEIEGEIRDGNILIVVRDNGVGMEEATADELNGERNERVAGGYGIRNVKRRIKLYFGEPYDLHIESTPGKGTEVTLILPALPSGQ